MELRTTFNIDPSEQKISYNDPVMFIGSCFATYIGRKFESGHMPVMINPSGTVFNPASVLKTISRIISGESYELKDLNNFNGLWFSFDHYTDFSSETAEGTLSAINLKLNESRSFLSGTRFLFITFGTARVFRLKESGLIVSNCHKLPAINFTRELMSVNNIVISCNALLDNLKSLYPGLKVIFTISPVRHWKDGAHGNQVSKSVLFLAVEELLKHPSKPSYFPAYELIMDDLRDYRYYDEDMLHPSPKAIDYIWEEFSKCYFEKTTTELVQEIDRISKAMSHRIQNPYSGETRKFAENILAKIDLISKKAPEINLQNEKKYFLELIHRAS